jgi:hypothetical protein
LKVTLTLTSIANHATAVHRVEALDRPLVCERPPGQRFSAQSLPMPTLPLPQTATPPALRELALVVPQRTAAGQAALTRRQLARAPRQRTALFMVDGRRSVDIVLALASQAGATASDFSDLVTLGLVCTPGLPTAAALNESSMLPSSQSLHGDSTWSQLPEDDTVLQIHDAPLVEARALLMRAVRTAAPLSGAFTLRKLKRAATRAELEALLDEVEQRLRKPHRSVIAAQTLRHVRHLLTLPASTIPAPLGAR